MTRVLTPDLRPVPSPTGLAHLRIMERAATYPNAAVVALEKTYGEAFAFGFGAIRFHWLVGPEALRFVLEQPGLFRLRRAYSFLHPIVGDTALITSDEPEHLARRRQVQPVFHGRRVAAWQDLMSERAAAFFAQRQATGFDFYAQIRPHMLGIIAELLMGRAALSKYPGLLVDIQTMMDFANLPFLAQQLKVPLPATPWGNFVAARRRVNCVLQADISDKRGRRAGDGSILELLLASQQEDKPLSNAELRDQVVSLISAGFDTSSAALTWALYLLLTHPQTLTALRAELEAGTDIRKLALLDAVVKETLRLYPPAPAGLRETAEDVVYKQYLIPAKSLLAYSIYVTQRQEASFEAPLEFKPERWLNGFTPPPFSYAPFGHGMRYCIGAQLATTLIKVHLASLLRHYDIRAAWTGAIEETGNTVHPKGGLPVQLSAR